MSYIKSSDKIIFSQDVSIPAPKKLGVGVDAPEAAIHAELHDQDLAIAILGEGYITTTNSAIAIIIVDGGSGYADGTYTINVNGAPGNAVATIVVSGGVFTSAVFSTPGAGFLPTSNFTVSAFDLSPIDGFATPANLTYTAHVHNLGIGIKGVGAVGFNTYVDKLVSVVAGSPEKGGGDVIGNAFGLEVEDVANGNKNWAIKTGVGTVEFNDSVKALATTDPHVPPFAYYGNIVVGANGAGGPIDLCIVGDYLYTANVNDSSVSVVDISIPSNPIQVANLVLTGMNPAQAFYIAAQGTILYVASLGNGSGQLTTLDISIPNVPVQIGSIALSAGANDVKVVGRYAYIVTFNALLHVIDVSNPANMTLVGTGGPGGGPIEFNGIDILGKTAYVVSQDAFGGHLWVLDISDPTNPTISGSPIEVNSGQPWQIAISGHFAYITLNQTNSLAVMDLSGFSPTLLTTLTGLGINPNGIAIAGRYAYVACSNNTTNEFDIIDISMPTAPVKVRTLSAQIGAMSVVVNGPWVYTTEYMAGTLATYHTISVESASVIAGAANIGNMRVSNDADIRGELQVGRALVVRNGIVSNGDVVIHGNLSATTMDVLPTIQNVGDPSSLNVDLSQGTIINVLMNGSISLTAHNMVARQRYTFAVAQAGGNDTLIWDTAVFKGAMTISAGAGSTSIQEFLCIDGAHLLAVSPGVTGLFINPPPM